MRPELCALCGRPYALDPSHASESECPGLPCWKAALNALADANTTTEGDPR